MYEDLFSLLLKSWDRPIRESSGYKMISNDNGYQLVLNTLGIKEEDLKINLDQTGVLSISGKTENKAVGFTNSVNYKFDVSKIKNDILKVEYEVADGLTVVGLILHKEEQKQIEIVRK